MRCDLDNSATTAPCPETIEAVLSCLRDDYGNPSSLHAEGERAALLLRRAREKTAAFFGLPGSPLSLESVVFTSGGTEANNLALFGGTAPYLRRGGRIVSTQIEHPSVLRAVKALENRGFALTLVPPDKDGDISAAALAEACTEDTVLVSAMAVNNETGAILPVEEAAPLIRARSPRALLHCDAVQAAGKMPLAPLVKAVDLLSISAHKLHGPKGAGALYVRRGVRISPEMLGGGQENGLRAGTEATPAIAGMAAAIGALPDPIESAKRARALMSLLIDGLGAFPCAVHRPKHASPFILSVSFPGYRGETLVRALSERGVLVSSGSACARGKRSPVLTAMGLPAAEIDSAVRISLSHTVTREDIAFFLAALPEALASLSHR